MSQERFSYRGLGYVGVEAPDVEAWRSFALGVCGMMPARIPPEIPTTGEPNGIRAIPKRELIGTPCVTL